MPYTGRCIVSLAPGLPITSLGSVARSGCCRIRRAALKCQGKITLGVREVKVGSDDDGRRFAFSPAQGAALMTAEREPGRGIEDRE